MCATTKLHTEKQKYKNKNIITRYCLKCINSKYDSRFFTWWWTITRRRNSYWGLLECGRLRGDKLIKIYKIRICFFSTKHTSLRGKTRTIRCPWSRQSGVHDLDLSLIFMFNLLYSSWQTIFSRKKNQFK